jgi:hypothetical protein
MLFPASESLFRDIPAEEGKNYNLFLQSSHIRTFVIYKKRRKGKKKNPRDFLSFCLVPYVMYCLHCKRTLLSIQAEKKLWFPLGHVMHVQ